MEAGAKLNLTTTIRSAKTGRVLPKKGHLISVTKNFGRTLLLVEFENGQSEYLFENEVELQDENFWSGQYGVRSILMNRNSS